tara:strand:- start:106 stop:1932 length:1827 start_codon:yes stop_codon:yes gene_type:complete
MPFSSGTFTRTFDCTTDRDNGVKILASKFDTELDGFATGLTTTILKDGSQTCTAAIPFAEGITLPDNKTITLGTNSDITIQYDETTNDSLEIAAAVEGAALGIVLKADQGDDNADHHKMTIADGGTLTLDSKISGSFVSYFTHTPNATVASSTTAIGGNLTAGGDVTITGDLTVTGDDITMSTNTAGHLLIADGTNFNPVSITSLSSISSVANDDVFLAVDTSGGGLKKIERSAIVAGLATSSAISNVVDDSTPQLGGSLDVNGQDIVSVSSGNITLTPNGTGVVRVDGTNGIDMESGAISIKNGGSESYVRFYCESSNAHYTQLQASPHSAYSGNVTVVLPASAGTMALTSQLPTSGISSGNVATFTSGVADDDFLRVDGTAVEGRSAAEVLSDIAAMPLAGGAFTGDVTFTGASHNIVFDASDDRLEFADNAKASFGTGNDISIHWDGTDGHLAVAGTLNVEGSGETLAKFIDDGAVELYHNNSKKIETTANGVSVSGVANSTTTTDTSNSGSVTLDFDTGQNFILTLTGNVTLANPSTENAGQSGFIIFIQDSTGSRTVSLGTDYETASGAGLTLSTAASSVDIVPYVVQSSSNILLGSPQLAFS